MNKPILGVDYVYRAFEPRDLNFIMNSWLKSYADSPAHCFDNQGETHFLYYHYQKLLIAKLLTESQIIMIVDREDDSNILGYLIYKMKPPILVVHYGYIVKNLRGFGLMRELLGELKPSDYEKKIVLTHLTYKQCYVSKGGTVFLHKKYKEDFSYFPTWSFGA